jgi:PAS domain S-box-containing protein
MRRIGSHPLMRAALLMICYLASAALLHGTYVFRQAVLWLPTGVAVSALWLLGLRWWPLIGLATLAQRALAGYSMPSLLLGPIGNALEALTAVALLRRLDFRPDFRRTQDVIALVTAAAVAPLVSATLGRTAWLVSPDRLGFFDGWVGWWRMNALGIVVVVPLVLSWASQPWPRARARAAVEVVLLAALSAALVVFLVSIDPVHDQSGMVLSYLALPVALYAAFRFGVRGGSVACAAIVVVLNVATVHGAGPFVYPHSFTEPAVARELALQAMIATVSVTPLLLGALISERESALAAIAVERERHQELLASINRNVAEGLFRVATDGRVAYVNTALADMLGHVDPEQALGTSALEWFAEPAWSAVLAAPAGSGASLLHAEMTLRRHDGSSLPALVSCTAVRGPHGEVEWFDGAVSDITERKRLEDSLRHAQKMEALGKLAGGVAHDFNNLLTVISGYAEELRNALPEGTPMRTDADQISRATSRAAGLTRQLLAYSRRQRLDARVLDLREVTDQLARMLRRLIGEDIGLDVRGAPEEMLVRVDRGQIEQVIINLVLNARDAMASGGTIELEVAAAQREDVEAHATEPCGDGPHVRLTVRDSGVGMDAETVSRAFDPFFTTKDPGRGTGLGLSTVYGIVRQSGGTVWIDSAPNAGTRVHVCLPRETERHAEREPAREAPPRARTPGTVLVVEDEETVRDLITRVLRGAGHTVIAAADGEAGLEAGLRLGRALDLLVTDIVMPRLGGRELAARLTAARPGLPVLFVSGYARELADPSIRQLDHLQKPFTPAALVERVAHALESAPPSA